MIFRIQKTLLAIGAIVAVLLSALLSGCQVESNYDEGGIGGSGLIAGRVTNTQNLHIEGRFIPLDDARIIRNSQVINTQDAYFNVGEYISFSAGVSTEDQKFQTVEYSAPVIGPVTQPVESIDGLSVAGQSVLMTELVVYSGFNDESELNLNDVVEISGYRGASDVLHATRVTKYAENSTGTQVRLVGPVRMLGRDDFMIGDATVSVATLNNENGLLIQDLEEGELVSVVASDGPDRLTYAAISIYRASVPALGEEGSLASISGISGNYEPLSQSFSIKDYVVRLHDNTVLDNGVTQLTVGSVDADAIADIVASADVIVSGTVDSQKHLVAGTVIYLPASELVEFSGVVEIIDESSSSIVVGGINVTVSAITMFTDSNTAPAQVDAQNEENNDSTSNLILTDLSVGDQVRILGIQNPGSGIFARQLVRIQQ